MALEADLRPTPATAAALRRLHATRAGFAVVWAVLLLLVGGSGSDVGLAVGVLVVLYPLVDAAAAVVDARASAVGGSLRHAPGLALNVVVSAAAAVGLLLTAGSGVPAVLRVWGVWAVVAGVVQLVVAVRRWHLGGQGAMVASGGISTLAGASFVVAAGMDDPVLTNVAGYAVAGAIFFLVSAYRLGRAAR